MYALLRAIAGVALRWYYRDIRVEGLDRVPRHRPLLLVVNHPNALVDALLVGWALPRRIMITAKASLFANPAGAALLRWIGVLPLIRAADEDEHRRAPGPARNRGTFTAVHRALADGAVVLIFPEGITHDAPSIAPLKTGAARMALHAYRAGDVPELAIVPIGLTFERKEAPRSRVLVQIGEPMLMADWRPPAARPAVDALTAEIERRMRAVTLNYETAADAARTTHLASLVAALVDESASRRGERSLALETAVARRITTLEDRLALAPDGVRADAGRLIADLDRFEREALGRGLAIEDIALAHDRATAARLAARDGALLVAGAPVALWGTINHWIPFTAARAIALRSIESNADPAMRTVIAGTGLVLAAYVVQSVAIGAVFGWWYAVAYAASLPVAADVNFLLRDRLRIARRRLRASLVFRRDPALRERLWGELQALRVRTRALEQRLR